MNFWPDTLTKAVELGGGGSGVLVGVGVGETGTGVGVGVGVGWVGGVVETVLGRH